MALQVTFWAYCVLCIVGPSPCLHGRCRMGVSNPFLGLGCKHSTGADACLGLECCPDTQQGSTLTPGLHVEQLYDYQVQKCALSLWVAIGCAELA